MESSSKKRKAEENGVANLTAEHIRKIADDFTNEQLMQIVQEAAKEHRDVREHVRSIADENTALRKLFVRGLSLETTAESLNAVFSPFGELLDSVVIINKSTGKSKGYGFVTFSHVADALNALKEPRKRIDGHITVCQFALAGFHPSQSQADAVSARKIYVGNLPVGMDADRLVTLFSQYGEIEEGPLGFDKKSGSSKRFAIFIFKTAEAANRALEEPTKTIDDGHQLFCKLANERQNPKPRPVNCPTATADGSGIHVLMNQTGPQVAINPGQGVNNQILGINQQAWNPSGITQPQRSIEQNPNGVHVVGGYTNYNYMNQVPQAGGYGWGQSVIQNGFQPNSGVSQLQSTGFVEGRHYLPSSRRLPRAYFACSRC